MIYRLEELLIKMGAPEVREKKQVEWHYFDKSRNILAGSASIRLEGEKLVAELRQMHENFEDDHGKHHASYTETFYLVAVQSKRPGYYRIEKIAFDGEDYEDPTKAVIELGLSVFHARALDISIRMVEQTFNKQDIVEPAELAPALAPRRKPAPVAELPRKESFGVVIPFRPRAARLTA